MLEPFPSLSHRRQVRRMAGLARTALEAYALDQTPLRLLSHLWNTTFRVVAPKGDQYVLRIHHASQTSVEMVRSELLWLAALREEIGLPVPEPVPNREQELVMVVAHPGVPQPRLCVLFRWVEGRFIYRSLTPSHVSQVGSLMARLHNHAAHWRRPAGFTRHRVENLDPMLRGQDDHFNEEVAAGVVQTVSAVITLEAGAVVAAAIRKVWADLRALGESPEQFGLVHGDLHQANFLFHHGIAGAIDFDDCGFGHWLYDLAVPLTGLERHPAYPALREALLAGYRQVRSLPAEQEAQLETFIALRRVQNVVGVIAEREHPAFQAWWEANVASELQKLRALAHE